tara:strand:+ start:579 stop:869 length:291 start_codon:yes stop_codon:yes gene_type:complete
MDSNEIEVIETYWKSVCKISHSIGRSFPKDNFRYWDIEDFKVQYNHWEDSNEAGEHMLWNESELNDKQVAAFREWSNSDNEVTGESNGMGYLKHKY